VSRHAKWKQEQNDPAMAEFFDHLFFHPGVSLRNSADTRVASIADE